jgi:hypothetical protein
LAGTSEIGFVIIARPNGPPVPWIEEQEEMLSAAYDILRKDAAALIWVEAVSDLETARLRVKELIASSQGEYVIFDQRTRQIIA